MDKAPIRHIGSDVPPLPVDVLHTLGLVMIRAHELRALGRTKRAVTLLREAAAAVEVKHAAAGMQALADLFAAHPPKRKRAPERAAS